jgi:hypothetical protein
MKEKTKKELLIIIGLILLAFYVLPRLYAPYEYILDPYDNSVEYRKKRWFLPDEVVELQWRKDFEGNEGWCVKDENGDWYIFVVEDFDEEY